MLLYVTKVMMVCYKKQRVLHLIMNVNAYNSLFIDSFFLFHPKQRKTKRLAVAKIRNIKYMIHIYRIFIEESNY